MNGAREYASIFETGQYGRLYLVSGSHARGKTFHIWVLPNVHPINGMPWTVKDAIEVYGITGGQPGWTETYGWLHRGKWEQDFYAMVEARRAKIAEIAVRREQKEIADQELKRQREEALLANY